MKATLENLKSNREEIIKKLTVCFGKSNLKASASILKDKVEFVEFSKTDATIDDLIREIIKTGVFSIANKKTKKTAEMIAEMAMRRGEVYDAKQRKYVKF